MTALPLPLKTPTPMDQRLLEIWADVPEYEGRYQVSSWGNIRSLDRYDDTGHFWRGRILNLNMRKGRAYITLCKCGLPYKCQVSRLVAQAFIPNPDNLPEVNHLTGDPACNYVEDMEWSTNLENIHHAYRTGLSPKKTSKYFGVQYHKHGRYEWRAGIRRGKFIEIGHFKTELGAAWAYENFVQQHKLEALHNVDLPELLESNPDYSRGVS